jgi:hypothetical protein
VILTTRFLSKLAWILRQPTRKKIQKIRSTTRRSVESSPLVCYRTATKDTNEVALEIDSKGTRKSGVAPSNAPIGINTQLGISKDLCHQPRCRCIRGSSLASYNNTRGGRCLHIPTKWACSSAPSGTRFPSPLKTVHSHWRHIFNFA